MKRDTDHHHSSALESILEYRLLAELTTLLWQQGERQIEVFTPDVDNAGWDVGLEVRRIVRHIQLKSRVRDGTRRKVEINRWLADKPSGCVIWYDYNPETLELGPFRWFGGDPGQRLPELGDKVGRHTRGTKAERPNLRVVRESAFTKFGRLEEVVAQLFGETPPIPADGQGAPDAIQPSSLDRLRRYLLERSEPPTVISPSEETRLEELRWLEQVRQCEWTAIPPDLTYENSSALANLIDGYKLLAEAGLGEPMTYLAEKTRAAREQGGWRGTALELWIMLFLQHRADRQAGEWAAFRDPLLDDLCRSLRAQLLAEAGRSSTRSR